MEAVMDEPREYEQGYAEPVIRSAMQGAEGAQHGGVQMECPRRNLPVTPER